MAHVLKPRLFQNILQTIGNTPIVRIAKLEPKGVEVYVKPEFFNPLHSVKDRLALAVIEDAERKGLLKPGQTVIEATSGNTGIALAMVCAQKGYPLVICMTETFSVERRKIMRMLGAKVVLTPGAQRGTGMVKKAQELAKEHGWFLTRQFENDANAAYHEKTTGPEIHRDFGDKKLDWWVTGYGTGGTFQGAGKALKAARPDLKIALVEPTNAPLVKSGKPQARQADLSAASSHEAFTPHPIQGWTPDFIPKILEDGLKLKLHDEIIHITGDQAIATSRRLAREEGIFTGISGGGSVAGALMIAAKAKPGSVILTMLPDTAERYLSTPLFADIAADMDAKELEISKSSPGYQLPPAAPAAPAPAAPAATPAPKK